MPRSAALAGSHWFDDLFAGPGVREGLHWLSREKQWINQQHLEACRIPAPTFLEGPRATWMTSRLENLGWNAKLDKAGNVTAVADKRSNGPLIALTAHLDTVLAPRAPEDIRVDAGGRFLGPGVADNGAGLSALLAMARVLTSIPNLADCMQSVLLVGNVGEEGEGNLSGMRYLCQQSRTAPRVRAYLILDGPSLEFITSEALASRRFDVTFTGPGGHSWSDFGNGNPVHALSRAITYFNEAAVDDPLLAGQRYSFNFGVLEGGASVNAIPAHARAKLDLRSGDERLVERMIAILSQTVEQSLTVENNRATEGRISARIREIGHRPGGRLEETSPTLAHLRNVDQYLGISSRLDCSSTDANIPLSMGLEAVAIGAGGQGGGAHTAAEWYHPESRDLGLHRILLLVVSLVRSGFLTSRG